jgi:hypothetical protein
VDAGSFAHVIKFLGMSEEGFDCLGGFGDVGFGCKEACLVINDGFRRAA